MRFIEPYTFLHLHFATCSGTVFGHLFRDATLERMVEVWKLTTSKRTLTARVPECDLESYLDNPPTEIRIDGIHKNEEIIEFSKRVKAQRSRTMPLWDRQSFRVLEKGFHGERKQRTEWDNRSPWMNEWNLPPNPPIPQSRAR
jgi:hypothetical protein